jgi:hypothetical protein
LQGTGEAIREAHFVSDHAAAMFDELFEGAHSRTLGLKGRELIAMLEQEVTEECGVGGGRPSPGWGCRPRDTAPA